MIRDGIVEKWSQVALSPVYMPAVWQLVGERRVITPSDVFPKLDKRVLQRIGIDVIRVGSPFKKDYSVPNDIYKGKVIDWEAFTMALRNNVIMVNREMILSRNYVNDINLNGEFEHAKYLAFFLDAIETACQHSICLNADYYRLPPSPQVNIQALVDKEARYGG